MLVLTRRKEQKILFPNLGVSVEIVGISGKTVRLGIDAPKSIRVVREEVAEKSSDLLPDTSFDVESFQPLDSSEEVKQNLDAANLALHLAQNMLRQGLTESAEETLQHAIQCLNTLEHTFTGENEPARQLAVHEPVSKYRTRSAKRALVIERKPKQCDAVRQWLLSKGLSVTVPWNEADAIKYLLNEPQPELVVTLADQVDHSNVAPDQIIEPKFAGLQRCDSILQIAGENVVAWTVPDFNIAAFLTS